MNVHLVLTGDHTIVQEGLLADYFPMKKMDSNQFVERPASVTMGGNTKEEFKIIWDDEIDSGPENIVELTI